MTPPRRASALKSVDVTGTDNVGQGFRPNSDHRPTEYAKIWKDHEDLLHHECLPREPSRCPHSRDFRSTPAQRHPPPGAAVPTIRSRRSGFQGANLARLPLENEPHERSRPTPLPHERTTGTCRPQHHPPNFSESSSAQICMNKRVHAQQTSSEVKNHGVRSTPWSDLAAD
jgi:hypothetical protein